MRSITLALLSLATALVANSQQYNITSAPFTLTLTSDDGSVNDTLSTCHTGAALESLCLSHSVSVSKGEGLNASTFNFNTSANIVSPGADLGMPGILAYVLPANPPIPSSLQFFYDPTTNIALPVMTPGDERAQQLAFDNQDYLTLQGYVDWSVNPPNGTGGTKDYYRWYACRTYFSGYEYDTLNWGLGPGQPEQPSCVKVSVKRVFLSSSSYGT